MAVGRVPRWKETVGDAEEAGDQVGGAARARREVGRLGAAGGGGRGGRSAWICKELGWRPTWVGKRGVKGDPKDAGLSNRKDRVLCVETEETARGQNSTAQNPNAPLEKVLLPSGGPFWPQPATEEPLCLRSGEAGQAVSGAAERPRKEPRLQRSWPKPAAADALSRGERLRVVEGGGWRKLLELLAHLGGAGHPRESVLVAQSCPTLCNPMD